MHIHMHTGNLSIVQTLVPRLMDRAFQPAALSFSPCCVEFSKSLFRAAQFTLPHTQPEHVFPQKRHTYIHTYVYTSNKHMHTHTATAGAHNQPPTTEIRLRGKRICSRAGWDARTQRHFGVLLGHGMVRFLASFWALLSHAFFAACNMSASHVLSCSLLYGMFIHVFDMFA